MICKYNIKNVEEEEIYVPKNKVLKIAERQVMMKTENLHKDENGRKDYPKPRRRIKMN